jgi:hypothetical protein
VVITTVAIAVAITLAGHARQQIIKRLEAACNGIADDAHWRHGITIRRHVSAGLEMGNLLKTLK